METAARQSGGNSGISLRDGAERALFAQDSVQGQIVDLVVGVLIIPWQLTSLARQIVRADRKKKVTCTRCGLQEYDPDASYCKACGQVVYQEYAG